MAKPDCDDGWLRYAHELDAALAIADFSKGARLVLHEVFSQVYGLAKLPTARLSPKGIGDRSGQHKANVARAIRELTDAGVLRREADGSYRFLKDYAAWTTGQRGSATRVPRLAPVEVAYCKSAPAIAKAYQHGYDETSVIQRDNQSEEMDKLSTPQENSRLSNGITKVIQRDNRVAPAPYRNGRPRAPSDESERRNVNVGPLGPGRKTVDAELSAAIPTPDEIAELERVAHARGQTPEARAFARLQLAAERGRQAREGQPERPRGRVEPLASQGKPRTPARKLLAGLTRHSTADQVGDAARALAAEFDDRHSVLMYRKRLGEAVAGAVPFTVLMACYRAARSPSTEKPGARFVAEWQSQLEAHRDKAKTRKRVAQVARERKDHA